MRLIDADKLLETIKVHDYPLKDYLNSTDNGMFTIGIQQAVDEQPAVDAVPVVRCRDCKWWVREGNDSYGYAMFCDHDCSLGGQGIKKPQDYCSYGERKGGDEK